MTLHTTSTQPTAGHTVQDNTPNIGVIGTGNMGLGMAKALLQAGYRVHGCDIDPVAMQAASHAGVQMHASPSDVAQHTSVILIVVVNAQQIQTVLFDLQAAIGAQHTVLLMSTIAPSDSAQFAQTIVSTGAKVLDAPISGGPVRASLGQLSLMLAGNANTIAGVSAVTHVLANRIFVMGDAIGQAMKAKLLNNLLAGIHLAAGAQILQAAQQAGLDGNDFLALTQASSGQSWIAADRLPRVLEGDYEPRAHLHILTKDVRLANEFLAQMGCELPLGLAAQTVFEAGIAQGLANLDDASLFQLPLPKKSWAGQQPI